MHKKKLNTRLLWSLGLVLGALAFLVFVFPKQIKSPSTMVVTLPSPVPTPAPLAQISPDGTHTVSLRTGGDSTQILVNDQLLTVRRVVPGETLLLPFNAWSPNDAYFFLEDKTTLGSEYLVFTASGKPIAKDTPYFSVVDAFAKAYPTDTLVAVTGWASPTLIVLNATSSTESKMSFWFDVQTQKFIRLSTYFN